jgi:opacity protein-like surface antigen
MRSGQVQESLPWQLASCQEESIGVVLGSRKGLIMKQLLSVLCAASVMVMAGTTAAQNAPTGFYVKGDIGMSFVQDTELEAFFDENVDGIELEFDPGLRLGAAVGYQVTDWFSPEIEFGAMMNEIESAGPGSRVDAMFSNLPLLLNAKFQLPNKSIVTPYAALGVGMSTMVLDADYMEIGATSLDGSDADAVFTWQALAGLRFALSDNMGLSLEYRYVASDEPEWEADFAPEFASNSVRFGETETHAISISFDFRF